MSLESRIERLGAELERPVVLYDHTMRLVAHSAHRDEHIDSNRSAAILARRTAPRALELVRASGAQQARSPVVIASDPGVADRIGISVRHEGTVLGYVVCTAEVGDLPVPRRFEELLVTAAADLGAILHRRALENDLRHLTTSKHVSSLLHADVAVRRHAAAELLADGLPESPRGWVAGALSEQQAVAGRRSPVGSRERLLAAVTRAPGPWRVGTVLEDVVVVLAPVVGGPETALDSLRHHRPPGGHVAPHAGLGSPRARLEEMAASVAEARIALAATWRDPRRHGRAACWSHLGADQLLLRLPLDALGLEDLPAPVRRLLAAPGGAGLADTVESYLEHGADAQATARALSIHRSTLYYRLDRAATLAGVDPREGHVRHELHLGLRVATLAGLRPAVDRPSAPPPRSSVS